MELLGSEQNPGTSDLKVLIVGQRGVGKSTAGNSLLGKRVFETKFSDQPVTKVFKSESRIWRQRKILIIDSPSLLSLKDFKSGLQEHTPYGPHAFLLVTPLVSFIEKDWEVLRTIESCFEDTYTKHMMVLLTRKEDLGDQEVDVFLTRNKALSELIKKCENRYSVFNYRATEREEQVDELLQKIVGMAQQNGEKPCSLRKEGEQCTENILYML